MERHEQRSKQRRTTPLKRVHHRQVPCLFYTNRLAVTNIEIPLHERLSKHCLITPLQTPLQSTCPLRLYDPSGRGRLNDSQTQAVDGSSSSAERSYMYLWRAFRPSPTGLTRFTLLSTLSAAMKLLTEPVVYTAALGVFCLILYKIIYNIYLHPLSHIPGSKIATCSFLYEFYHNVLRGGMYMWEIEKMHQKYGTVRHLLSKQQSDRQIQAQSYASFREKSTSKTRATTTKSTLPAREDKKSTLTLSRLS